MTDTLVIPPKAFSGKNWSRQQVMLAFHFYCQTPFGQLDSRNRKVIELAELIGRTPGAVAMKCGNIASLDPAIVSSGRVGLRKASHLDRKIWADFHADWERLAIECEQLRQFLLRDRGSTVTVPNESQHDITLTDFTGETRQALVQQRVKQNFFRRAVLAGYRGRCCISGVSDSRFLVASHIVPWSVDKANRLNPSNGLCLSSIHDKAFDSHLFTLSDDWRVVLSSSLKKTKDTFLREVFWPADDKKIELPERFVPDLAFVEQHRSAMFAMRAAS